MIPTSISGYRPFKRYQVRFTEKLRHRLLFEYPTDSRKLNLYESNLVVHLDLFGVFYSHPILVQLMKHGRLISYRRCVPDA